VKSVITCTNVLLSRRRERIGKRYSPAGDVCVRWENVMNISSCMDGRVCRG